MKSINLNITQIIIDANTYDTLLTWKDGLKDASEFSITMGDNSIRVTPEGAGAGCVVVMVTSYDVGQQPFFPENLQK